MNTFVVLNLLMALIAQEVHSYTTQHDHVNVDAIVEDKIILQSFFDCFTDIKPCNARTQEFKNNMLEIVQESCAKCNPTQKRKLKEVLQGMSEKLPAEFVEFKKTVDPESKHYSALEVALAKA